MKRNINIIIYLSDQELTHSCEGILHSLSDYSCTLFSAESSSELSNMMRTFDVDCIITDFPSYESCVAQVLHRGERKYESHVVLLGESTDKQLAGRDGSIHVIYQTTPEDSLAHGLAHVFVEMEKSKKGQKSPQKTFSHSGEMGYTIINAGLRKCFKMFANNQKLFALLIVNLDNLMSIDEMYSYDMSAILLERMSQQAKLSLRAHDTLAQIDRDKIAILLQDIKSAFDAGLIARKLLNILAVPLENPRHNIPVIVSIGVSVYSSQNNTPKKMLEHAESAALSAKDQGGNQFQFYSNEFTEKYKQHISIEGVLGEAISRNEFYLVYQPRYDIKTNRIVGVECLIRWSSSELGFQLPDDFISVAEESNMIIPIGQWSFNEACRQYSLWKQAGYTKGFALAVNFSLVQMSDENMASFIQQTLNEYQLRPDEIDIELTESSFAYDDELLHDILKELSSIGVKIFIDDFGTGFASFEQVKCWPVSGLKIDKGFVQDIGASDKNDCIVDALLQFSKKAGLTVIAEGVETKDQLDFLAKHGCDEIQGFYFSRPLSVQEIEKLFSNS